MKKISLLYLVALVTMMSCKNEKKENDASTDGSNTEVNLGKFVVKPEATTVKWTAYKTTAKVPVNGEFKRVEFDEQSGETAQDALNDLKFSIPISSLFTNDPTGTRDPKIIEHFFGIFNNPNLISGRLTLNDGNAVALLTMNNVTKSVPMEMTIEDERRVTLKAVLKLEDWDALKALASINEACFDLHKGEDGVSKTWEDVAVEVSTFLREN